VIDASAGPPLPPAPPAAIGVGAIDTLAGGPRQPPPHPFAAAPASDAVLALPLGIRELLRLALDLLTRSDAGLRAPSFYIGLRLLLTALPVAILAGIAIALDLPVMDPYEQSPLTGVLFLAGFVAFVGYVVAAVDSRALATAVIGGRVEGRPLRLGQAVAVDRRRFWSILGAQLLVGILLGVTGLAVRLVVDVAIGSHDAIDYGLSLVVGTIAGAPFAYVATGIVLGEVGVWEAVKRSWRLAMARKRLAVVVTLFSVVSSYVILFGISIGADAVVRFVSGTGLADRFPVVLVVPIAAALTFAFGTLMFLVEAIVAAPAVHAFLALTHYGHGLEVGRRQPARARRLWQPWLTPGVAILAAVGWLALAIGLTEIP
jgi:hypothetical protein